MGYHGHVDSWLWQGLALGFAAGVAPGPLLALVIAESARGGWRRGVAASLAPPVTDALILPLALWAVGRLPAAGARVLALAGGLFLGYLAWDTLRAAGRAAPGAASAAPSPGAAGGFARGLLTNLLNPHPWLFWFTVGAPLVLAALRSGGGAAALFLASFFLPLVGSKAAVAVLVDRGVRLGGSAAYAWLLRLSAGGLAAVGVLLLARALRP